MTYSAHRPRKYQGQGDSHLPRIVRQLQKTLSKTQRGFAYDIRQDSRYRVDQKMMPATAKSWPTGIAVPLAA